MMKKLRRSLIRAIWIKNYEVKYLNPIKNGAKTGGSRISRNSSNFQTTHAREKIKAPLNSSWSV